MKHECPDLRNLDLATSRHLDPDVSLDPKTAELREGWLALGESLSRRQARDYSAFAAVVAAELSVTRPAPVRAGGRRWVVLGALAAIAAAALVAVSIWTAGKPASRGEVATGHSQFAPPREPLTSDFRDAADWDDPLDGQIDSLQEQFGQMTGSLPGLDASLSALDQQLAELADDLDAGSL